MPSFMAVPSSPAGGDTRVTIYRRRSLRHGRAGGRTGGMYHATLGISTHVHSSQARTQDDPAPFAQEVGAHYRQQDRQTWEDDGARGLGAGQSAGWYRGGAGRDEGVGYSEAHG